MNDTFASLLQHRDLKEGADWRRRRYAANEFIFREGDDTDTVYLILEGSVRILADLELEEGRHIHPGVCDLGDGEVFGELALFDRGDLKVTISGDGWVTNQSPPPGTKITKGMELHLELH